MRFCRAQHLPTTWIAVLAILLSSLAPTLSHALSFGLGNGAAWLEVCSSQGAKWVQPGADQPGGAPAAAHVFEHCPYCSVHAPGLGLPPVPGAWPAVRGHDDGFQLVDLAAPRTARAWLDAQPRAPPRFA